MSTLVQQARFLVLVAIVVLTSYDSSAQYRSAIKVQTFRVLDGLFTLSYEHALHKHFSAQLSLEYGNYIKERPNLTEAYKATGIGLIGAFRYYPFTQKHIAPQGFFVYTAFRNISFHDTYTGSASQDKSSGNILNIGGGLGYKFVYRRFGIEGFVGWGAGRLTRHDDPSSMPVFFQRSMDEQIHFPQLDVALCYML